MSISTVFRRSASAWIWLIRVGVVAVLTAPVLWALAARVPDIADTQLVPDHGERIAVPIELSYADYPASSGPHIARMRLDLGNVEALGRHEAIHVLVANYETNPQLDSAEIAIAGTECAYRTPSGAVYANNSTLPFVRGRGCHPLRGTPSGHLLLTVRFSGPGRLGLWTYRPPPTPPDPSVIYLPDPAWSEIGLRVELRGKYVDNRGLSAYRRADLLAYMWAVSNGSSWLWTTAWVAVILLLLGALALPGRAARGRVLRASIAAFFLSGGISLFYVVLVPPFQAPDEPSHFLGYGYVTDNLPMFDDTSRWGWRAHFMRLRGHPHERFRPIDIGQPHLVSWTSVSPLKFDRSSITVPFWRHLSPRLKGLSVQQQLLALRCLNAVLFALAIAACTAMIGLMAGVRRPEAIVAVLLLAPGVPFFGTYVSNYAPAVAAYALLACACLIIFLDARRADLAGLGVGLGLAFAVAATRSALPMLCLVSIVLLGRIALGSPYGGIAGTGRIAIFWGGILAGAMALAWLFTDWYAQRLVAEVTQISELAARAVALALAHPLWMAGLISLGLGALEWIFGRVRTSLSGRVRQMIAPIVGPVCLAGMAVMAVAALASLAVRLPRLEPAGVGVHPSTLQTYVGQTLASIITAVRLRDPDFLLSTTFWGAFGWVDTLLPSALLVLLPLSTGVAAAVLLSGLRAAPGARRFCWLITIAIAFLATMVAYAAATFRLAPDLHGRYLIGPYLVALVVAWSRALGAEGWEPKDGKAGVWLARTVWLLMGVAHSCAFATLVRRYF